MKNNYFYHFIFFSPWNCHEDASALRDIWACHPHPKYPDMPNSRSADNIDILGLHMTSSTWYIHHASHTAAETSWHEPAAMRVGFNVTTRPQELHIPQESLSHLCFVENDKFAILWQYDASYMTHMTIFMHRQRYTITTSQMKLSTHTTWNKYSGLWILVVYTWIKVYHWNQRSHTTHTTGTIVQWSVDSCGEYYSDCCGI